MRKQTFKGSNFSVRLERQIRFLYPRLDVEADVQEDVDEVSISEHFWHLLTFGVPLNIPITQQLDCY
jgi:hypothetical protein